MPPVLIAVAAAAAAYGGAALAVSIGIAASMTAFSAIIVGALAGALVAYGLGALLTPAIKKTSGNTAQDNKQMVRSSIQARRIIYGQVRVSGPIVYAASSGQDNEILHLVIVLASHPVESIGTIWINDDVWDESDYVAPDYAAFYALFPSLRTTQAVSGNFAGRVYVARYDGTQTFADPRLIAESPDGWSASHKLLGMAYLYVRLVYDKDKFQQGIPNISALVKGRKVYDPRSGTTAWSDNWALCIRDYLTADFGLACAADEYDDGTIIAAANIADEAVYLDAGHVSSQKRYRLNGSFLLDEKPIDIMEGMLAAGAGALTYVAGSYRLYAGAYIAPSATLTGSDFAGSVELQTMPSRAELFNAVKGTFIDPNKYWQASEFPSVKDSAAIAADGEEIWREVDLKFVTDTTQAQRLARQALKRNRAPLIVKAPLRYASLQLTVWQTVAVTLADFGWSAKPFRITSWTFNPSDATVTATLQEEQVAAYAWVYEDAATVPDVPDTTLISPLNIPAPTGVTLTATTSLQGDGGTAPALAVAWTAAAHAFVTAYEVQWQDGSGPWSSQQVAAPTTRLVIAPIITGQSYAVRVRALAGMVNSDWSGTASGTGAPDTTAPSPPTAMSVAAVPRGFSIRWTNPIDSDLDHIAIWETATAGGAYAKVATSRTNFASLTNYQPDDLRYFALQSVDRSGNASGLVYAGTGTVPRNGTNDIQISSITGAATTAINHAVEAFQPTSGFSFAPIGGLTVTLEGDGRALIYAKFPHAYWTTPTETGGGGTGAGDSGGPGGGGE